MTNESVTASGPPIALSVTCSHPPAAQAPAGLSPFAAKVLDQLSVTAWLPAALLMTNTYLLVGMYLVRDPKAGPTVKNLEEVVSAIDSKALGVIIAVLLGIVLATLFTQSLEFAAIRFLEGYWGGSVFVAEATRAGVWIQRLRQYFIARRVEKLDRRAFRLAVEDIRFLVQAAGESSNFIDAAIAAGLEQDVPAATTASLSDEERERAAAFFYEKEAWRPVAPPHLRHRALSLDVKAEAFPEEDSRLLPTRLGCALRAHEDSLSGDVLGSNMRSYLYRHLDDIGPELMEQHNQSRNRLDMCSVMTVLCVLLAILDAALVPTLLPKTYVFWTCSGLLGLSYLSYRGAVAAALDYGPVLVAINENLEGVAVS
jgi:hypothetical protein